MTTWHSILESPFLQRIKAVLGTEDDEISEVFFDGRNIVEIKPLPLGFGLGSGLGFISMLI